jgi:hypothetical protein
MSESNETVVEEVAPGQFAEAVQTEAPVAEAPVAEAAAVEGPKEGELILFTDKAKSSQSLKWGKAANTLFRRPDGTQGPVQWLCADTAEWEAAGSDFYALKYAGVAKFQPPRIIDIPAEDAPVAQA